MTTVKRVEVEHQGHIDMQKRIAPEPKPLLHTCVLDGGVRIRH